MDDQNQEALAHLRGEIDAMWRSLEHLNDTLGYQRSAAELREEANQWHKHADQIKRDLQEFLTLTYSETRSYINTICAIGFAGYFAIWALAKDALTLHEKSFVALRGCLETRWRGWMAGARYGSGRLSKPVWTASCGPRPPVGGIAARSFV
ncbi:MAG TPA: hypothetical protein VGN97_22530, partial [Mesorhizobium sp.]|nr:hypothetical protein [Mesorhizobium sp.]